MSTAFTGLDEYKLTGVEVTDRILGRGAYATVLELEYMGLKCAGKKIHELLLAHGNSSYAIHHFQEECKLLSKLLHPNIVQFLGVFFEDGSRVPILVMEYLPTNLTTCIEDYGVLPDDMGYPILHGISLGLCFLHNQTPPIIHRDLSSNNVLLNANLTAKISDLGVARILNMNHLQASHMTQIPGTPAYMPPEVMAANPNYDVSVDVFSYGIMIVHVLCGKWPEPQIGMISMENGKMIPVSEAERRQVFLDVIGSEHPLMSLVLKCIHNDPKLRPHTNDLVKKMAAMVKASLSDASNQLDKYVRSRTESVLSAEKKVEGEGSVTGCIRRRPVYKIKAQPSSQEQEVRKAATFERKRSDLMVSKSQSVPTELSRKISAPEIERKVAPSVARKPIRDTNFMKELSKKLEVSVSLTEEDSPDYENSAVVSSLRRGDTQDANTIIASPLQPICVAKYDYSTSDETKLSFKKGDTFSVIYNGENWWIVRSTSTGKEGLIPSNYVEVPLEEEEVDHSQISLVKRIGSGRFSVVWEGRMYSKSPIAVKVLKEENVSDAEQFLVKAVTIKTLSHPRIVHIVAVCTKKMPVYVAFELMKYGNMLRYLRNEGRSVKPPLLISMASQVAEGMAYLEHQGYIHRDLGARSVLVGESLSCKLANFHLAKAVHGQSYRAPTDDVVAIKWTAPEAMKYNRFTIKSDVWSFGVLLYEIITHGRFPYPGMRNNQVVDQLIQGYRMPQPIDCPHRLYTIMLDCWREEPNFRPSFQTLHQQLHDFFH